MFSAFRYALIGGLLLPATSAGGAEPARTEPTGAVIRIRVYDYAGVSPSTLARAKATASGVLGSAGVRPLWADCRLRAEDPVKDEACRLPITPVDLVLRLIDKTMADATHTRNCLGFARHNEDLDWLAAAYVHKAVELEEEMTADRWVALGGIMAHEVGHLLLDGAAHSSDGIMRPTWSKTELKKIARGRMRFTPAQASKIAENVARRVSAAGEKGDEAAAGGPIREPH